MSGPVGVRDGVLESVPVSDMDGVLESDMLGVWDGVLESVPVFDTASTSGSDSSSSRGRAERPPRARGMLRRDGGARHDIPEAGAPAAHRNVTTDSLNIISTTTELSLGGL